MSTTPPEGQNGGPRPKEREDDARGAAPGAFGQQPFVPTEEQRKQVRALAQVHPEHSNHRIAVQLGISRSTLERHFRDDIDLGRANLISMIGQQMIQRALKGDDAKGEDDKPLAPGNLDAQKFILARLGGWTTKVEMTGKDGRPMEVVDLSGMTPAALREYGRQAAIANGLDPDEAVGPPLDDE